MKGCQYKSHNNEDDQLYFEKEIFFIQNYLKGQTNTTIKNKCIKSLARVQQKISALLENQTKQEKTVQCLEEQIKRVKMQTCFKGENSELMGKSIKGSQTYVQDFEEKYFQLYEEYKYVQEEKLECLNHNLALKKENLTLRQQYDNQETMTQLLQKAVHLIFKLEKEIIFQRIKQTSNIKNIEKLKRHLLKRMKTIDLIQSTKKQTEKTENNADTNQVLQTPSFANQIPKAFIFAAEDVNQNLQEQNENSLRKSLNNQSENYFDNQSMELNTHEIIMSPINISFTSDEEDKNIIQIINEEQNRKPQNNKLEIQCDQEDLENTLVMNNISNDSIAHVNKIKESNCNQNKAVFTQQKKEKQNRSQQYKVDQVNSNKGDLNIEQSASNQSQKVQISCHQMNILQKFLEENILKYLSIDTSQYNILQDEKQSDPQQVQKKASFD